MQIIKRSKEQIAKWLSRGLTEDGQEKPDPLPVAPPIGYRPQPSMFDEVRRMVASERLRLEAEAAGFESFDEADDFDIPDDPVDPSTPYEAVFDPVAVRALQIERKRRDDEVALARFNEERRIRGLPPADAIGEDGEPLIRRPRSETASRRKPARAPSAEAPEEPAEMESDDL